MIKKKIINISYEVVVRIQNELDRLEHENDIKILYAAESGSRAWGFESQDSDFDVRFIYVHTPKWYLSLQKKRDVIERPITDDLDITGWDLQKTLRLLHKSNPPLLEQLQSPMVYRENEKTSKLLKDLVASVYNPPTCMHHYFRMAEQNYKHYLQGEQVWLKKYFYTLRPILACNWVQRDLGPVPMEFEKLMNAIIPECAVREAIEKMLVIKRDGAETNKGDAIPEISSYIMDELNTLAERKVVATDTAELTVMDNVFIKVLTNVYGLSF